MWNCSTLGGSIAQQPRCDLEAGLAVPLTERNNWHRERFNIEFELDRQLPTAARSEDTLYIGTDGGFDQVATCGAVFAKTDGTVLAKGGRVCEGLTHTSFGGELEALRSAVHNVELYTKSNYTVGIDNIAVQRMFQALLDGDLALPNFQFRQWYDIFVVLNKSDRTRATLWVPSHGKKEKWMPQCGTAAIWRRLNDAADCVCTVWRQNFEAESGQTFTSQDEHLKKAEEWASQALERSEKGGKHFIDNTEGAELYRSCFI